MNKYNLNIIIKSLKYDLYSKMFLLFLCFTSILYIGEDSGNMIAGTRVELNGHGMKFVSDIRAYINEQKYGAFKPNRVDFRTEVGKEDIFWTHECYHGIDRGEIGIKNRDYITWRVY